jgi:hypothetical protein|tara:strand:+ start:506 stop:826 length:321 start_codon:yes stop_codon:yes gene_type:complete
MKKIIILLTTILLSFTIAIAEEKKTLADTIGTDCINKHKISPGALGCGIKKLFKKKDGSPNALGKFYNAKSFADLGNKKILETPDYKPKMGIMDKLKEKIGSLRKK